MLTLLRIKNLALIDDVAIEFGGGLNLLTGETGSGKSIIVDSLAALTGERVSSDLIKDGRDSASIEGLFTILDSKPLNELFDESGIEAETDLIIRREISVAGKNRVFINGQLATQGLLRRVGRLLVDIHGQGAQTSLYDVDSHGKILDEFADTGTLREKTRQAFTAWSATRSELAALNRDEAEKLHLIDILRFQVSEITTANLQPDEDTSLEEEKRRLNNIEKLTGLADEAFDLLYERDESSASTLDKAAKKIDELSEFESRFGDYRDGLTSARAVVEDLALALRDYRGRLEFSPERLEAIETRLADISRLNRKYGGSIENVIDHLRNSEERLANIETAELREEELKFRLATEREVYLSAANQLHEERVKAAAAFSKIVEQNLREVAMDKARFDPRIEFTEGEASFSANGSDGIEFYFSANPGEPTKPLAKVASGGEASRLMLILKSTARSASEEKTAVFDEIDIGIGGRVAESVGRKLKDLAATQQVFCVTHQPQIASLADRHFFVEKTVTGGRTSIDVRELGRDEQVEEIARMLAGETVTDAARENARAMIASAGISRKKAQHAEK